MGVIGNPIKKNEKRVALHPDYLLRIPHKLQVNLTFEARCGLRFGMEFWCARPSSFNDTMFEVDGKYYYSVDHSLSYYWNSASYEISEALLPFL